MTYETKYLTRNLKPVPEIRRNPSGEPEHYKDIREKSVKKFYCPKCEDSFEHLKKYARTDCWNYGSFPEKLPKGFNVFNQFGWPEKLCKECE
jgi:5-methylcytosine-specific restriction endonuclease McrA